MRFTPQHLIESRAYASARDGSPLAHAVLATVEEIEALDDTERTPLPDEDVDMSEFDKTKLIPAHTLAALRRSCR